MKKAIVYIFLIVMITTSCIYLFRLSPTKKEEENELANQIEELLNSLTLEEKIAQMIIISNPTPVMTESLKKDLETYQPGGFIFFKDNFSDFERSRQLITEIKNTARIPMLLSIDQEGGRVQRITNEISKQITTIPPMQEIGDKNSQSLAYEVGKVIAEELQVFEINMNFAPVLDIFSNPQNNVINNRSFGTNAKVVSNMGLSLGHGLLENGVIPVYKHFPGHGDTTKDSHVDLPIITKTKKELEELELIPFKAAIEDGAEVIMVGHLAVPSITGSNIPASLSSEVITGLLKEEMGFKNLVITDALNMKALTKNYTEREIYEQAIHAGVDLLLMPESLENAIQTIKESCENQTISVERIDTSVRKILTLKYTKLKNQKLDQSYLGSESHQKVIQEFQK